jgi:integrase
MTNKPKFTYCVKGKFWRFRRGAINVALPGQPGEAEFEARYNELLAATEPKADAPAAVDRRSLKWLITRYQQSAEFKVGIKESTRTDYVKILNFIEGEMGAEPFEAISRSMVKGLRDRVAEDTPRKAQKVQALFSLLYAWADQEELVEDGYNPTARIKKLKNPNAKEIICWSEEEIDLFLAHCPAYLKTPFLLALYTGQRRCDVVKMDWTAFQGNTIRVVQTKTGEPLDIACHSRLKAHLDAIRTPFNAKGAICRSIVGSPMKPGDFTQRVWSVVQSVDAMPKNRSPHGLRYAAAARLEEAGVTAADIAAVTGHRAFQMGMKYASQRKRNAAAIAKQERHEAAQGA